MTTAVYPPASRLSRSPTSPLLFGLRAFVRALPLLARVDFHSQSPRTLSNFASTCTECARRLLAGKAPFKNWSRDELARDAGPRFLSVVRSVVSRTHLPLPRERCLVGGGGGASRAVPYAGRSADAIEMEELEKQQEMELKGWDGQNMDYEFAIEKFRAKFSARRQTGMLKVRACRRGNAFLFLSVGTIPALPLNRLRIVPYSLAYYHGIALPMEIDLGIDSLPGGFDAASQRALGYLLGVLQGCGRMCARAISV